jgi:hypothetical protein
MMAAPYRSALFYRNADYSYGDTTDDLGEGQQSTSLGSKSTDEDHTKRDSWVEKTSRNSEEDPSIYR